MRRFGYQGLTWLGVVFTQIGGVVSFIFGTAIAAAFIVLPFLPSTPADTSALCGAGVALWFLAIGLLVSFGLMNAYPTVWLGEEGILISAFLFTRVPIAWTDIVDVGAGRVPFGHILVRARRITPTHRIYGWMYSRSLYPSFIIRRDMEGRDELIYEIRRRLQD